MEKDKKNTYPIFPVNMESEEDKARANEAREKAFRCLFGEVEEGIEDIGSKQEEGITGNQGEAITGHQAERVTDSRGEEAITDKQEAARTVVGRILDNAIISENLPKLLEEKPRFKEEVKWIMKVLNFLYNEKSLFGNTEEIRDSVLEFMFLEKLRSFLHMDDIEGEKQKIGARISDIDKKKAHFIPVIPLSNYPIKKEEESKEKKEEISIPVYKLEQVGMILKVLSKLKEMKCIPIYYVISAGVEDSPNIMATKDIDQLIHKSPLPVLGLPGFEEKIIRKLVAGKDLHVYLIYPEFWEYFGADEKAEKIKERLNDGDITSQPRCSERGEGHFLVTEKEKSLSGKTSKAHYYYINSEEAWWKFMNSNEETRKAIMRMPNKEESISHQQKKDELLLEKSSISSTKDQKKGTGIDSNTQTGDETQTMKKRAVEEIPEKTLAPKKKEKVKKGGKTHDKTKKIAKKDIEELAAKTVVSKKKGKKKK